MAVRIHQRRQQPHRERQPLRRAQMLQMGRDQLQAVAQRGGATAVAALQQEQPPADSVRPLPRQLTPPEWDT